LNRFLAADLVFILGILLSFFVCLMMEAYCFGPIAIRKDHGPKSIANRHGMPCRTVPERRPYSRVEEKAQQSWTLVDATQAALSRRQSKR
jgi:hypothetical protein